MTKAVIIDVSSHNGLIHWDIAARKAHAAIIRSSYALQVDARWQENKANAKRAGVAVSAYHFFNAGYNSVEQAELFADQVGGCDFSVFIDVEGGSRPLTMGAARFTSELEAFIATFEQVSSKPLGIYTAASWWNANVLRSGQWSQHDLWIAHWGVEIPAIPADWQLWRLHQYSAEGNYQGAEFGAEGKHMDISTYNGTVDDFAAHYGLVIEPKPEPITWQGWATQVVLALRLEGIDVPDAPGGTPGSDNDLPLYDVLVQQTLNVRDAPAGKTIGTVRVGARTSVYEEAWAMLAGTNYQWGKIAKDASEWIAISHGLTIRV
jgi:lysozyme